MKRIVISILSSAGLVFGYFIFLSLLYQIFHLSFETLAKLLIPLNLPYEIYKSIFGLYYGNPTTVKVLNFIGAILLYAIPIYLFLTVFAKIEKQTMKEIENPPEPPIFED